MILRCHGMLRPCNMQTQRLLGCFSGTLRRQHHGAMIVATIQIWPSLSSWSLSTKDLVTRSSLPRHALPTLQPKIMIRHPYLVIPFNSLDYLHSEYLFPVNITAANASANDCMDDLILHYNSVPSSFWKPRYQSEPNNVISSNAQFDYLTLPGTEKARYYCTLRDSIARVEATIHEHGSAV